MESTLLSGSSFKEFFGGMEFIKIVSSSDIQKYSAIKLNDGLNEIPLRQTNSYVSGGIDFCDWENFIFYLKKAIDPKFIRKVEIIDESTVFVDNKEYLTDKAILGEKY